MSKRSGSKAKTRNQQKTTKPPKHKVGDILDSSLQPKSRDRTILQKYMKQLLLDDKCSKKAKLLQGPISENYILQSEKDISTYLKDVIHQCTCELSAKESIEYLLGVVRSSEINALGFSDSLVDKARDLLPSVTYQLLVTSVVQEAQQSYHDPKPPEFGETLLSYLHIKDDNKQILSVEEWKAFVVECKKEKKLLSIFKHLVAIGGQRYVSTSMDLSIHPGLEFLLLSEDSVDGLALLLQDEVQQSKDQPACFFSSTELGCLLSRRAVIQRVVETNDLFLNYLLQRYPNCGLDAKIFCFRSNMSKTIQTMATALGNILKSNSHSNRPAALAWMAAVINANSRNRIQDPQDRSHDAYLVTFSEMLLRVFTAKLFPENLSKSFNFSHYCRRDCGLNLEGEKSLTRVSITIVGGQRRFTLTDAEVAEELIACCLRAVGSCLVPVLRRWPVQKISPSAEYSEKLEYSDILKILDEKILWDDNLHCLVAQMYVEQCKLLLRLLGEPVGRRTEQEDKLLKNKLSRIPAFFGVDMANWVSRLFAVKGTHNETLKKVSDWECIFSLCVRLLQCGCLFKASHWDTSLPLIRAMGILARCGWKQEVITSVLTKEIRRLLPILLRIYKETEFLDVSTFSIGNWWIAVLLNTEALWTSSEFKKILNEQYHTTLYKEFLASVFRTLQSLLCKSVSALQSIPEKETKKPIEIEYLEEHCSLLDNLDKDKHMHRHFSRLNLFSLVKDTLCCIDDVLGNFTAFSNIGVLQSEWQKDLKVIIGRCLQRLAGIVEMYFSTPSACLDLSPIVCSLEKITNSMTSLPEEVCTELMATIKKLQILHLNQKAAIVAHEPWVDEYLQTPLNEDSELAAYLTRLQQARSYSAHLLQSHSFHKVSDDNTSKLQTQEVLKEEWQRSKRTFPSSPSSVAFFVNDTKRADVMRCAMSGPVGTPYGRGLFVFDIFCPADYPSAPPKVKLLFSVDGTVFFGPHVENNEVSLASLQKKLGYRNSGDWSITKVLHLLKSLMLTAMKETTSDGVECTNGIPRDLCQVRAQTVRHAMLEPLKNPPVGLEKVVNLYFVVQQQALLKQCARWVQESPDNKDLRLNVSDLYSNLQALAKTAL